MNLKTKAIGLLAGSALALSLASGAMAVDDSTDASVDLEAGACAVSVDTATVNFGVWTWDGEKYVNGTTTQPFNGTVTNATPTGKCTINVTSDGLKGQIDSDNIIDASNLLFKLGGQGQTLDGLGAFGDLPGGPANGTLELTVPDNVQPDNYEGTIDFTVIGAV